MNAETLKELLEKATPGAWKRGHIHEREFPNHHHLYSELGRRADGIMRIKTIAYFPKRGTPEQTTADADLIALAPQLAADNIALQAEVERWRINSIDTWSAMNTMRNSINEHVPMPSIEGDLLQGPENSVFCASVAEAVIGRVTKLEAENAKLREALVFYADSSKYPAPMTGGQGSLYYDCGQVARNALNT